MDAMDMEVRATTAPPQHLPFDPCSNDEGLCNRSSQRHGLGWEGIHPSMYCSTHPSRDELPSINSSDPDSVAI